MESGDMNYRMQGHHRQEPVHHQHQQEGEHSHMQHYRYTSEQLHQHQLEKTPTNGRRTDIFKHESNEQ